MNKTTRTAITKLGFVLCFALPGFTTSSQPSVSVGVSVPLPGVEIRAESDFYEPLTPYGRWAVVGSYGRCWIPGRVEADWRPYCNGYWQRTDAGWYWTSVEPWAWATYHYGRWDLSAEFGWYWVPQTQWAPAWVSWHSGGGYIGWAPLYPSARFARGGSVEVDVHVISPRAYVFVEERRFLEPVRPSTVVVNNTTIINKTVNITNVKVANNTVINEGPATAVIEKSSGRKVQAVAVGELRHKDEARVVVKQPTPATIVEKPAATPVRSEVVPREKTAVVAPAPPPVARPAAAAPPSVALVPKINEAPSATPKPVPATAESKPAVKPEPRAEGNPPAAPRGPTAQKANQQVEKQAKPAKPTEKKPQIVKVPKTPPEKPPVPPSSP